MAKTGVSEQILKLVREKTGSDPIMRKFLTDMLFEESKRPDGWWAIREYKRRIAECCEDWRNANEDH